MPGILFDRSFPLAIAAALIFAWVVVWLFDRER